MKKVLFACLGICVFVGCKEEDLLKSKEEPVNPVYKEATWNPVIVKFSSCGEIDHYLEEYRRYGYPMYLAGDMASPGNSAGAGQDQPYENQVDGVLEGDILQTTPDFFIYARANKIEVVTRKPLASYKSLATPSSGSRWLLVKGDQLIYIGNNYNNYFKTIVRVYDMKNDFQQIYEKQFGGFVVDFRLVDNKLRIVTQDYYYYTNSSNRSFDCTQVYRPNIEDGESSITLVHQVELADNSFNATSTGFMGRSDFIHMTSDELLLFRNGYSLPGNFRVVKFDSRQPSLEQVQTYEGMIKDRWSVLAKNNTILFASTLTNSGFSFRDNKIFVYEKMRGLQYELASETPAFGENENIRSVRYFMDKAYVVTFRQTDPLFIFDIKEPKNIKLLGSLESPGFSTQLRELSKGLMFGLGYAESQSHIKVSLFDVLDPFKPVEVQTLIWGDPNRYSSSSSEALQDPKAIFFSKEKDRIVFPATVSDTDGSGYRRFIGALVLDVREAQVREAGRITHLPLHQKYCNTNPWAYLPRGFDIQRAVQIEDDIFSFSRFGVMRSSGKNFSTQEQVAFKVTEQSCY